MKKGDKLRRCADYKVHVNGKINSEVYFVLKPFSQKCQALNDLSNAYWQIPLMKTRKKYV